MIGTTDSDEHMEDAMEHAENGHSDPYYRRPAQVDEQYLVKLRCACSTQLTATLQTAAIVASAFTSHEQRCTRMQTVQTCVRATAFVLCAGIAALAALGISSGRPPW